MINQLQQKIATVTANLKEMTIMLLKVMQVLQLKHSSQRAESVKPLKNIGKKRRKSSQKNSELQWTIFRKSMKLQLLEICTLFALNALKYLFWT
jgi:hypothetical protein